MIFIKDVDVKKGKLMIRADLVNHYLPFLKLKQEVDNGK